MEPPAGVWSGGGSDGNLTAAIGIPTLDGLGAVGGRPHARDEHADVRLMPDRAAFLAALIGRIHSAQADRPRRLTGLRRLTGHPARRPSGGDRPSAADRPSGG